MFPSGFWGVFLFVFFLESVEFCIYASVVFILFFIYLIKFIYLFWGCTGSQFQHVGSFVAVGRLLSSCGVRVFFLSLAVGSVVVARGLRSLRHAGSLVEACELSSCGSWAQLPRSMWDLSSLTRDRTCVPCIGRRILYHTGPPGKSLFPVLKDRRIWYFGQGMRGQDEFPVRTQSLSDVGPGC